jgi:hypothetical protein
MKARIIAPAVVVAALAAAPALAHHSMATFEPTKQVEIAGTVREFRWTNPHAWIELEAKDKGGKTTTWGVELTAPNVLVREGWTKKTVEPGDEVVITVRPLRDGGAGGVFVKMTTKDGKPLPSHIEASAADAATARN